MTAAVDVRDSYLAEYEAFMQNGGAPRGAPAWLSAMRERAIAHFAEQGFPSMRQEDWRFTSVAPIAERAFARNQTQPTLGVRDLDALALAGPDAIRIVIVNGVFAPDLSSGRLPARLRAGSLKSLLEQDPAFAERHLGHYVPGHANSFAALNTAFLADGALIHVPAGVEIDRPIELLFVTVTPPEDTPGGDERPAPVTHTRALIVLDAGARATVVENYGTVRDGVYWTNAVSEIAVADGARLECLRVQRESRHAYQVATTDSWQGRDSLARIHPFALGAGLARHDLRAVLDGSGAELILNGFYLLRGSQHADHHTVIDHARPHGTSHEYFNGIVGEQAHGVFSGRIIVRPGAQRTDSKQTNNNLLLSTDARADSQPQLEIYADDVKCTHGSTVGPLDETALYYLRTRGLSHEMAAAMLTYGLAAEILGRIGDDPTRTALERIVRARLAERTAGGRRRSAEVNR